MDSNRERERSIKIMSVKLKKKYLGRRLFKDTFEIKAHSFFISGKGMSLMKESWLTTSAPSN